MEVPAEFPFRSQHEHSENIFFSAGKGWQKLLFGGKFTVESFLPWNFSTEKFLPKINFLTLFSVGKRRKKLKLPEFSGGNGNSFGSFIYPWVQEIFRRLFNCIELVNICKLITIPLNEQFMLLGRKLCWQSFLKTMEKTTSFRLVALVLKRKSRRLFKLSNRKFQAKTSFFVFFQWLKNVYKLSFQK